MRILCMLVLIACAHEAQAYRLVGGGDTAPIKWGDARLKTGARVTYAFARTHFDLTDGFRGAGCTSIVPLDPILSGSGITEDEFRKEAQRGIDRWARVADVSFVYTEDVERADVIIGAQALPRGRAFANVRVRRIGDMRIGEKAIICINPEMILTRGRGDCRTRFNIAYLLSHEFGHVLGLDHPAPKGSLMAFVCSEDHQLNDDDAAGARYLYGPAR
jgi:hypothetical protein